MSKQLVVGKRVKVVSPGSMFDKERGTVKSVCMDEGYVLLDRWKYIAGFLQRELCIIEEDDNVRTTESTLRKT